MKLECCTNRKSKKRKADYHANVSNQRKYPHCYGYGEFENARWKLSLSYRIVKVVTLLNATSLRLFTVPGECI
jgi:hypothetical protein